MNRETVTALLQGYMGGGGSCGGKWRQLISYVACLVSFFFFGPVASSPHSRRHGRWRLRGGGGGGSEIEGERRSEAVIQPANPAPVRQFLEFTVTKGEPAVHLAASQIPLF